MKQDITYTVDVAQGVDVTVAHRKVTVKGKNGEISRPLMHRSIAVSVKDGKVVLHAKDATKRKKMHMGSLSAHIKNMVAGVQNPYTFKLKVCASHFPMNVAVSGNELVVKNFLGEKVPRTIKFSNDVKVKVAGDIIEVTAADIELAGSTASKFEGLAFINKRDRRIFQDGIYITFRPGVDA